MRRGGLYSWEGVAGRCVANIYSLIEGGAAIKFATRPGVSDGSLLVPLVLIALAALQIATSGETPLMVMEHGALSSLNGTEYNSESHRTSKAI